MCDSIYKGSTKQTFKRIMYVHLSNVHRILKTVQKSDSFASNYKQHFKSNTSYTYLHNFLTLKLVQHLHLIGEIKSLTKTVLIYV